MGTWLHWSYHLSHLRDGADRTWPAGGAFSHVEPEPS